MKAHICKIQSRGMFGVFIAGILLTGIMPACGQYRSATEDAVNSQKFDANKIVGTYQVKVVHKAGKATQKANEQGVFLDQNNFVPSGYQMFEVVADRSIQTVYVSPSTNLMNQDAAELYTRADNVLTITSATGSSRHLQFTPSAIALSVVEDDGSYMIWQRVPDLLLQSEKSALHSELFSFQYDVVNVDGAKVAHPESNLSKSKLVKCERTAEGSVVITWSETATGDLANSVRFELNGIADKDFHSEIRPQDTTSTSALFNIEHHSDLQKTLGLTGPFSSGTAGATCSSFNLAVTTSGHINLQATCGPLNAISTEGAKYADSISLDLNCVVGTKSPAPLPVSVNAPVTAVQE